MLHFPLPSQDQADIGIMQAQVPGDRTLSVPVFLDRFADLFIALVPVTTGTHREDLVQIGPVRIALAPGYVGNVLMFPDKICHLICKCLFAKHCLAPHFVPDGLADAPADELPIFLFRH